MMKVGAVVAMASAMILLGGCAAPVASGRAGSTTAPSPPTNYLARSTDIGQAGSWAIDADLASGTLYEVQLEGLGETEQVLSTAGTVRLQGSHLKIEAGLPQGATNLLGSGTYPFTRRGGRLSVAVPWPDAGVRIFDFTPDTGDAYNVIVSRFDSAAQEALAAAEQQQQQPQGQQQQAEAAQLQAKAAQACSAVGGHIQGTVTVGAGDVSMGAYCAADPNRTWENPANPNRTRAQGGETSTCSGLWVPFNNDGTLNLGDLQNTEWNYPGCFG